MYFLGAAVDFLLASSPVTLELVLWLSLLGLLSYVRFVGQAELCPVVVFTAELALTSPCRAFFIGPSWVCFPTVQTCIALNCLL